MKKIKVTGVDRERAKIMEILINKEWEEHGAFISSVASARSFIENAYGIKTPDSVWNSILEEFVRINFYNFKERPLT